MFMVLSSWPWSLREFTRFIWGMQTERRGCHASLKASAAQLSTTPLSRGPPLSTGSVVGDRVLAGISVCPMGEESEDGRRKTSTQPELKRGIGATDNKHSSVNHGTTQPTNDWNGQSSWNPRGSNLLYATGEEEDSDIIASNMVNEAMDLNTAGRSNADDRDNYVRVSLRNVTRSIGTWNVRTLYQVGKLTDVIREMNRCSIQMLGIAETHWTGSGHFSTTEGELILYSGGENHSAGVGVILTREVAYCMMSYKAISTNRTRHRASTSRGVARVVRGVRAAPGGTC